MNFPTRTTFKIDIVVLGKRYGYLQFQEISAYDLMDLYQDLKDTSFREKWFIDFIKKHLIVDEEDYKRPRWMPGFIWKGKQKALRLKRKTSAMYAIHNMGSKLRDKVMECLSKDQKSIFEGITYPPLKGDTGSRRKTTYLEALILCCNNDPSRVQELLKTHTMRQILVLMDGRQLLQNEQIKEYRQVNQMAVLKAEGFKSKHNETKEKMKRVKEALRKGKFKTT